MIERIPKNFVLVEVESLFHEKIIFKDGSEFIIDTTYEPEKHNQVSGIVHTVPDDLYFNTSDMEFSMEYDVPIEIEKGDMVFFHYLQLSEAIKNNYIMMIDDKMHVYVRYDQCFCAIRNKEVIMLNGWILLEPFGEEETLRSDLINVNLPFHRRKAHPLRGEIAHIGLPVKKYLWSKYETDQDIAVGYGDKVMFLPHSDIPLEYGLHQTLEKLYYRVQRKDLLSKINLN